MPKHLFNAANAREYSAKGHAARREQTAARRLAEQLPPPLSAAEASAPDAYLLERLGRVRGQLRRIDQMILVEQDAQRLDRLAGASSKLSELERQLAGRPSPGAYRPATPRRRTVGAPLIPE